jgi:hypothetical protein
MPSQVIEKIKSCNCIPNYFGKFVEHENNAEPEAGYRNNFYIMKPEGKLTFRMKEFHGMAMTSMKRINPNYKTKISDVSRF